MLITNKVPRGQSKSPLGVRESSLPMTGCVSSSGHPELSRAPGPCVTKVSVASWLLHLLFKQLCEAQSRDTSHSDKNSSQVQTAVDSEGS